MLSKSASLALGNEARESMTNPSGLERGNGKVSRPRHVLQTREVSGLFETIHRCGCRRGLCFVCIPFAPMTPSIGDQAAESMAD
jgi:hypothetical protein